jgi:CRISPR/Cas system CMR subunit Cmr6 (Cas7 group RAMP superfamily)
MAKKARKQSTQKDNSQSLSLKLAKERNKKQKKRIVRLIQKGDLKSAESLFNNILRKNLADHPEVLTETAIYLDEKIPDGHILEFSKNTSLTN